MADKENPESVEGATKPLDWRSEQEAAITNARIEAAEEEMRIMELTPVEYARKHLRESLTSAVTTVVEVCETTEVDSSANVQLLKLRFDAAKYLIDRAFGSTSPTSGDQKEKELNPLEALLDRVMTSDKNIK